MLTVIVVVVLRCVVVVLCSAKPDLIYTTTPWLCLITHCYAELRIADANASANANANADANADGKAI